MKTMKLSLFVLAITFTVGFTACSETNEGDKVIEVESKERIIERNKDKVGVEVDANDGKLNVEINDDKKKVEIEFGKDDK